MVLLKDVKGAREELSKAISLVCEVYDTYSHETRELRHIHIRLNPEEMENLLLGNAFTMYIVTASLKNISPVVNKIDNVNDFCNQRKIL